MTFSLRSASLHPREKKVRECRQNRQSIGVRSTPADRLLAVPEPAAVGITWIRGTWRTMLTYVGTVSPMCHAVRDVLLHRSVPSAMHHERARNIGNNT